MAGKAILLEDRRHVIDEAKAAARSSRRLRGSGRGRQKEKSEADGGAEDGTQDAKTKSIAQHDG